MSGGLLVSLGGSVLRPRLDLLVLGVVGGDDMTRQTAFNCCIQDVSVNNCDVVHFYYGKQ